MNRSRFQLNIIFLSLISLLMVSPDSHAGTKGAKVAKAWFENGVACSQLEIERFETGTKAPTHTMKVSDADSIKTFMYFIDQISANGDEMRSFLAKETIELSFDCGGKKTKIEIFDGWFKTPNTAFNSDAKIRKAEKSLHDAIVATLMPDLKKKMLKFANVELKFRDFTVTYKGSTHFDYAPATVSGDDDHFDVKDKAGKVQSLKITSGQLPPQPMPFEVNGQKLVLETFKSPTYGQIMGYMEIHP